MAKYSMTEAEAREALLDTYDPEEITDEMVEDMMRLPTMGLLS